MLSGLFMGQLRRQVVESKKKFRLVSSLKIDAFEIAAELETRKSSVTSTSDGDPSFVCSSVERDFEGREIDALLKLIELGEREKLQGGSVSIEHAKICMKHRIFKN